MSHAKMNKEWEVRMIPPGDGCDGDHSCSIVFVKFWRDIDQQKANGFFQW